MTDTPPGSVAPSRVLVVDDEPMVREVVARYLEREGIRVHQTADGQAALDWLDHTTPDLVVLDIMLPHVDGLQILERIRSTGDIPVILLTARGDEASRVQGLELGADDYVAKPFSPRELAARVKSVLRRTRRRTPAGELVFGGGALAIDTAARQTRINGELVDMTAKEFELLAYLAASPREVFSRDHLLKEVWDSSAAWQDPSTVTVHVRRIRSKIEPDPNEPRWIQTVWGVGYRFEPNDSAPPNEPQ